MAKDDLKPLKIGGRYIIHTPDMDAAETCTVVEDIGPCPSCDGRGYLVVLADAVIEVLGVPQPVKREVRTCQRNLSQVN